MIEVTQKATEEVKRLIAKEEDEKTYLRVKVVGGGCSGMSYKLGFDTADIVDSDKKFDVGGVTVVVDAKSHLFIDGMTLDFTDGLNGRGFVFDNPKAKKTCGCGSSFSA